MLPSAGPDSAGFLDPDEFWAPAIFQAISENISWVPADSTPDRLECFQAEIDSIRELTEKKKNKAAT